MNKQSHTPYRSRSWASSLALSSCILLASPLALGIAAAHAQSQSSLVAFDIPAQALDRAVLAYADQAGIQVVFDSDSLSGLSSSAVQGQFSPSDGLSRLLADTPVSYRFVGPQQVSLQRREGDNQSLELAPINIEGRQQADIDRDSIYRTPGSVHKVTREQLDRVAYSRPGDIFQGVPGVTTGNTANGAGLELNIRGLQGMGRVRTLVDGAIQSTSNYRGYAGQREETYVDPDLLASVDIRKGPEAGPEGAGAIGGVVNMRTLSANDLITDPDKNWGLRIRGMHGNNVASGDVCSDGNYFGPFGDCRDRESGRVTSLYNDSFVFFPGKDIGTNMGTGMPDHNRSGSIAGAWRPLDNWDITLGYAKRESGNYYSGKRGADSWKGMGASMADQEVMNTSLVSESTLLKTSVRFLEDHSLGLNYRKYRSKSGMVDSTGKMITGDNWQNALSEVDSETHGLDYAWQPGSPWFNLQANYWNTRVSESYYGTLSDSHGLSLQNTSTLAVPAQGSLVVKYGGSFSEEEANSTNALNSGGSRDTTGLFITGDWQLTPWLALHAGLQHDKVKLEDGLKRGGDDYSDHQYEHTSPSYGITLTPWAGVQLFARWSEGMRAPALRETYYEVSSTYANPNLKPEYAKNFEYGINLLFDDLLLGSDQLGGKFAVFDNKYDDYIARITRAALGEVRDNGQAESGYRYSNIDKAKGGRKN